MIAVIWDNAPHLCSTYLATSGRDSGGGVLTDYQLAQSNIACLINTASSTTVEMYAQEQITVTHTIGIKSALLTTPVAPGMKVVADGASYHVRGIRSGRPFMSLPAFTYLDCEEQL